ncbi:MAG: YARHG domain-containing protein [Eggerthellaceae bacterium]|nr:YARHG domain-containing protein [Eggerthellaceae bacterium]
MKKVLDRRTFAKASAVALAASAMGLSACIGGDPNKSNGGNTPSGGNGGNGGNTPGPSPAPAPEPDPLPRLVPFNDVFFADDDTVYVGMPTSVPFLEVEPSDPASMYWLDIPGTVPVKRADYFAIYDGKLFFTEFIHPSDAAARLTCLYVAEPDGSNPRVILKDVAATDRPCIVDGVLYYESYDIDEGEKLYRFVGQNGGEIIESDAMNCTSVLRAYNLTTGETKSVDIVRTIASSFVGATTERVFVTTKALDHATDITSYALDLTDPKEFSIPGYAYGVDLAGHIIAQGGANNAIQWYVCDANGATLEHFTTPKYNGVFSSNRYLLFEDASKKLTVFDTVELKQVKSITKKDDWSLDRTYYYYDPATDVAYFVGRHGTIPGIYLGYEGWGRNNDYSVFMVEGSGQVRRVLPYLDVVWRRSGDWDSPKGYVLQWCEIDFYSYEQLDQLTDEQLFHARNEDFWCHGYDFNKDVNDPELQTYYKKKTWPRELTGKEFTAAERWNFAIIEQIEADRKSPYKDRGYTLAYLDKN